MIKSTIISIVLITASFTSKSQVPVCNDCDKDGILDSLEQTLAEKFAPIIFHDSTEQNMLTNVDEFLLHTSLFIYDDECDFPSGDTHKLVKDKPSQNDLIEQSFDDNFCGSAGLVKSNCTRSISKQRTYYLKDVNTDFEKGSSDTKSWTTYFHSYKNIYSGITIQYWRFYSFNTGFRLSQFDFSHGGDWESIQVVLDSHLNPIFADLLGHTSIDRYTWNSLNNENDHLLILSKKGSHSSIPYKNQQGVKQETWTNGKVYQLNGNISGTGALLNIGEKLHPMNGQVFIQYSGIWGSPGDFYFTSGYWSPSYNETDMNNDNQFIKAWCNEMLNAEQLEEAGLRECFPCGTSR